MPLTRRVQVFISQEASDALDSLCSKGLTQKQAIEIALVRFDTVIDRFVDAGLGELARTIEESEANPHTDVEGFKTMLRGDTNGQLTNSLSPEAKQARAEKKAGRAKRKAELQESVKESLRGSESAVRAGEAQRARSEPDTPAVDAAATYCPFHRPKWCAPDCKHRVKA